MITAIEIENFKGFGARQRIELAPITLLYGQNSCGKSSVFKSLFLFKNLLSEWRHGLGHSIAEDSLPLGAFRDFVHKHNEDQTIWLKVEISWSVEAWRPAGSMPISDYNFHDRKLKIAIGIRGDKMGKVWCSNLDISIGNERIIEVNSLPFSGGMDIRMRCHLGNFGFWLSSCFLVETKRVSDCKVSESVSNGLPRRFEVDVNAQDLGFEKLNERSRTSVIETKEHMSNAFESILTYVHNCLNSICYVGPLREIPIEENWGQQVIENSSWEKGLSAWKLLTSMPDGTKLLERANKWLKRLKTRVSLEIHNGLVRVRPEGFDASVEGLRIQDVGTGISQVVPLIVALCQSCDKVVLFEQPELHLNPIVQSELADLLIATCVGRWKWRTVALIETHSEGIIHRFKRRIREKTNQTVHPTLQVLPNMIAINYLHNIKGQTESQSIHLDCNGEFVEPWPDDFFDLNFNERFA